MNDNKKVLFKKIWVGAAGVCFALAGILYISRYIILGQDMANTEVVSLLILYLQSKNAE